MARPLATRALQLVAANLLCFLGYRWLFLATFADPAAGGSRMAVLLHGLRLDVALLGLEAVAVAVVALVVRRPRGRLLLGMLWVITYVNAFGMFSNFLFFRERNQHLWEMLLANLGRPDEVFVALEPFLFLHPLLVTAVLLGSAALAVVAWWHHRALPVHTPPDLWRDPRALAATVGFLLVGVLTNLEPIADQKSESNMRLGTTAAKHYMSFPDYVLNQAVVNPMFDLLHYYTPSLLSKRRYRLDAPQALQVSRALLALPEGGSARYPLLRTVQGQGGLGIRNVILLQVEGLGTNVLERRAEGDWVMPFVRGLAEQGLYFPNVYQSFSATDGSTFAVSTSLHRTFGPSHGVSHFLPNEVNGLYGALPRVLAGQGQRHWFFAGFKQRNADFLSFMSNQGYEAEGYADFVERLGPRAEREANSLGIFDGPMLREVAGVLLSHPGSFTAHVATATSHSPWQAPDDMPARLADPGLNSFRYTDQSIQAFVETLRERLPDYERTLFVVFGDHTSITFGSGLVERIRVPIVLYSPALARQRMRWTDRQAVWGSQVDILPTVLSLLDGVHPYSGMGCSLLEADTGERGFVSSTYYNSLYIKDGFAVRYTPHNGEMQLLAMVGGEIIPRDLSDAHPEVAARLGREYLGLSETADRLVREKRVFPRTEPVPAVALAPTPAGTP